MPDRDDEIERIAKEKLRISSFAVRGNDRKDIYELGVWSIKAALEAAYDTGHAAGAKEARR